MSYARRDAIALYCEEHGAGGPGKPLIPLHGWDRATAIYKLGRR